MTANGITFDRKAAYLQSRVEYATPVLKRKHLRQYDHEFWRAADCTTRHAVLEVGCGTGLFLAYLHAKGVQDFVGIDPDPALANALPTDVADRFVATDAAAYVRAEEGRRRFHRIAMFDVLEHLEVPDALAVLRDLKRVLTPDGRIVVRVPNAGSPWGLHVQFGSIDHVTAFTPDKLGDVARLAGYRRLAVLPQRHIGPPVRRTLQRGLHWMLDRMLVQKPSVWTANMIAVLAPVAE